LSFSLHRQRHHKYIIVIVALKPYKHRRPILHHNNKPNHTANIIDRSESNLPYLTSASDPTVALTIPSLILDLRTKTDFTCTPATNTKPPFTRALTTRRESRTARPGPAYPEVSEEVAAPHRKKEKSTRRWQSNVIPAPTRGLFGSKYHGYVM